MASTRRGYKDRYYSQTAREYWAEQNAFKKSIRLDPCSYCGGPGGTVDHIVAKVNDGEHGPENWAGACNNCNYTKNQQGLLTFLLSKKYERGMVRRSRR